MVRLVEDAEQFVKSAARVQGLTVDIYLRRNFRRLGFEFVCMDFFYARAKKKAKDPGNDFSNSHRSYHCR